MYCIEKLQLFQIWWSYGIGIEYKLRNSGSGRMNGGDGNSNDRASVLFPAYRYLAQVSATEISAVIQNLATIDCCSFQTNPACIIGNQTTNLL